MKSDDFVRDLGSAFRKDARDINGGYPVLAFQAGAAVSPVAPPATPASGAGGILDPDVPLADAPENSVLVEVAAKVSGGTATAQAGSGAISEAVAAALEEGKTNITVSVTETENAGSVELVLTVADISGLAENGMSLTARTPRGTIIFGREALAAMAKGQPGSAAVKIAAERADKGKLSPQQQSIIGDNPAFNLTVTVGVGASLFDARYGLAAAKPIQLKLPRRLP
jgi:hypothetical protein